MLVLSRHKGERIIVEPDKRAQQLLDTLREIDEKIRDDEFVGEVREALAVAIPLAEAIAADRLVVTAVKLTGRAMKLGFDTAAERKIVREELAGELKVPA